MKHFLFSMAFLSALVGCDDSANEDPLGGSDAIDSITDSASAAIDDTSGNGDTEMDFDTTATDEVDGGIDTSDGLNCADNHGRLDKDADLCWQYPKPAGELGWKDAINYCENLSLGGHTDWRLPQKEDFMDLLGDCHTATGIENSEFWLCSNCSNSAKCSSLFGSNSDWYWSIDQLSSDCDAGWTCGFGSGEIGKDCRSLSGVRCVRSEI